MDGDSAPQFREFCNLFTGRPAWIIGKGPTRFDYRVLAGVRDPVLFINDAVTLERCVASQSQSFLCFLENKMADTWLNTRINSTVLAPTELLTKQKQPLNRVLAFKRVRTLPDKTREEMAADPQLYIRNGTICPTLHFAWYLGCDQVNLIGCDGINSPEAVRKFNGGLDYDPRIENTSGGKPGWIYSLIRGAQDALISHLNLKAVYLGSPEYDENRQVMFCSFATPNYEHLLARLNKSAMQFGLDTHFEVVTDKGNWQRNCQFKADFIKDVLTEYPRHRVVWVDADALFRSQPNLFSELPADIDFAAAYRGSSELLSGTLYFSNSAASRELVAEWQRQNGRNPHLWDQKTLHAALNRLGPRVRDHKLPPSYTFIFDIFRKEHPDTVPVIEHFQASRQLKT